MKWLRTLVVFERGDIVKSSDWKNIHESYVRSILSIDFPEDTGTFTIKKKLNDMTDNGTVTELFT